MNLVTRKPVFGVCDQVVEWLERLAVVQKVAGSGALEPKDWKTLTVHPAANGYLINFREG